MGLFGERVGGENNRPDEVNRKTAFILVAGNGCVVAEDCHAIGEWVPVNVAETGLDETDGGLHVVDVDTVSLGRQRLGRVNRGEDSMVFVHGVL